MVKIAILERPGRREKRGATGAVDPPKKNLKNINIII
jgi:hypothetical protein